MLRPSAIMRNWCLLGGLILAFLAIAASSGVAAGQGFKSKSGVAIKGFDPVAFHTEKRAVKGKKEFAYQWSGANWHFKSAENRDLFASDPLRFAPQFGGN